MGKGDASGGAEPHPSGQALKQWPAELTFQDLDLMRKAGLAHVQPGGRRRERTVIDHSNEVLELAERRTHALKLSQRDFLSIGYMAGAPSSSRHAISAAAKPRPVHLPGPGSAFLTKALAGPVIAGPTSTPASTQSPKE